MMPEGLVEVSRDRRRVSSYATPADQGPTMNLCWYLTECRASLEGERERECKDVLEGVQGDQALREHRKEVSGAFSHSCVWIVPNKVRRPSGLGRLAGGRSG